MENNTISYFAVAGRQNRPDVISVLRQLLEFIFKFLLNRYVSLDLSNHVFTQAATHVPFFGVIEFKFLKMQRG